MFYQIFFSPQVKRCPIITYKHGIKRKLLKNRKKLFALCTISHENELVSDILRAIVGQWNIKITHLLETINHP